MRSNFRLASTLAAIGCLPAWTTLAKVAPATLAVEDVVAAVRARHPSLEAARARVEASEAMVQRDGAWEGPMVGIELMRERTTDLLSPSAVE